MKQAAFTIVNDQYYYPVGTHIFANSFKRFHPDIDLIIYRQDMVDKIFKEKNINFYQAKPYFGELAMQSGYDRVVNIDADTIILDRLTEVFDKDWEVGGVWNYNDYENASFDNITEKMYVQAGMVGSSSMEFWKIWQVENNNAMQYLRKENDTLNLVWYKNPIVKKMKRVIWDKKNNYLGCKSLGQEARFSIKNGKTYLKGEQVKAYHYARGNMFPKLNIMEMPLIDEVKKNWMDIAYYGNTITIQ